MTISQLSREQLEQFAQAMILDNARLHVELADYRELLHFISQHEPAPEQKTTIQ